MPDYFDKIVSLQRRGLNLDISKDTSDTLFDSVTEKDILKEIYNKATDYFNRNKLIKKCSDDRTGSIKQFREENPHYSSLK